MKRAAATSVLTLAGVLSAGAAAALVNSRILGNAEGGATETNRVELVEAPRLIGPGPATPALVTVPPATPAATTAVAASTVTAPADVNETPAVDASSDTAPTAAAAPPRPATPSTSRLGSTGARDPDYPSATAGATQPTVAPATPPTVPATVPPTPVTSTPSTAASTTSSTAPSTSTSTNVRRRPTWPRYGPSTSPPRWTPDD